MPDNNEILRAAEQALAPAAPTTQERQAAAAAALPDIPSTDESAGAQPAVPAKPEGAAQFVEENFADFFDQLSSPDTIDSVEDVSVPSETTVIELGPQAVQAQVQAPVVEPAPTGVAPVAAVPPVVQPGAAQPQVQQPVAGQAPQPGVVPVAAPQDQSAMPDPFALVAKNLHEQEEVFISRLAESAYKIDPQQFEQVLGGDSKALSTLCARVHTNAVSSVMRTVAAYLPVYVNGLLEVNARSAAREDRFWSSNPHLDKNQHRQLLPPVINAVRQMNPTADEATMNRMVGLLVATAHNIPMRAPASAPVGAPVVRTPGPRVKVVPQPGFAPAGTSAPNGAAADGKVDANEWQRFTEYMMADDRGAFDQTG